jgi:hypothetical protein
MLSATRQARLEAVACTPWFGWGRYPPLDSDTIVVFPDTRSTTPRGSHT